MTEINRNTTKEELLSIDKLGHMRLAWAARENKIGDIHPDVLASITFDDQGWLKPAYGGLTPFCWICYEGRIDDLPFEMLHRIPMNKNGWLYRNRHNNSPVSYLVSNGAIDKIFNAKFLSRLSLNDMRLLWEEMGKGKFSFQSGQTAERKRLYEAMIIYHATKKARRQTLS